jgi:dynactin-2
MVSNLFANYLNSIINKIIFILAANFSKLYAELETTQNIIIKGISSNKELLQSVQKAFVENDENTKKEFKKIEERVVSLAGKK